MEFNKITIDPILLTYVAQTLGRVPENLYDFQKIKNLSCGGKPVYQKLIDPLHGPVPERLEIVRGDFSVIGKMSRLKKLAISAMQVNDFSFLKTCTALESLEISACGVIDCSFLKELYSLKSLSLLHCSELVHMEDILKLFRLTRLSLEGSMISDASCFMNCRIKEIHLPEHCLKEQQTEKNTEKKAASKGQKAERKSCTGVPFKAVKQIMEPYSNNLSDEVRPSQRDVSYGVPEGYTLSDEVRPSQRDISYGVPEGYTLSDEVRPSQRDVSYGVPEGYELQDFDSLLWNSYKGAYGNVREYLMILMGDRNGAPETFKLRRLDKTPKTNYEIAFDNLCENLWHQMSFYPATWLAIPYLARLMEGWEKDNDIEWLFQGILAAGSCLATDVYGDKPEEDDVQESYENAILQIRDMTIDFLAKHLDHVREKEIHWRRGFAFAVTAILGEKNLAFMFCLSGMESCYIVCPGCENCDEEIEFGYFDPDERIEKAEVPAEKWDGESLSDVKSWLFNLFALLGDMEGMERLCYYFGTYTCPECGEQTPVFTGMEGYFL